MAREIRDARKHLKWCCHLYLKQVARGAYFLHEHPAFATSWRTPEIIRVLGRPNVQRVIAHQCQFGQQTDQGDPLKKPTGFMSNAPRLLQELDRQCFGRGGLCTRPEGGRHAECLGTKARRAAIFQEKLCLAILRGLKAQLIIDRRMRPGEVGVVEEADGVMIDAQDDVEDHMRARSGHPALPAVQTVVPQTSSGADARRKACQVISHRSCRHGKGHGPASGSAEEALLSAAVHDRFVDDLTGLPLPPELCRAARQKEIAYFRAKGVWEMRPFGEAKSRTGK